MRSRGVLLACLLVGLAPASADVYSWTDDEGVVHFTNMKPAGGKWKKVLTSEPARGSKAAAHRGACERCDKVPSTDNSPERFHRYDQFIQEASDLYRIPVPLIRAVIKVESDYDPKVVSSMDCKGLMQVHPQVEIDMGATGDIFDPRTNIMTGTRLLRWLANRVDGDLVLTIAGVKMRVEPTGGGSPQRTESLARELVRGLLGSGAAPTLEVMRGPAAGIKRALPPPEATWIIGRGDEATWVILDEDLSREHVEIERGWDGVTIRDLDSKNGTRLDGKPLTERVPLRDGAKIELGNCELVFRDPAEKHLQGELATTTPEVRPSPVTITTPIAAPIAAPSRTTFLIATGVCGLSVAALLWVLSQ